MAAPAPRIEHPNRRKAASQATRMLIVALLIASIVLMVVVTIGGWDALVGAKGVQVAYIAVYVVLAVFVLRWSRGVLPLIAALAVVLLIFAAVSAPAWYDRDGFGYTDPALPADLLGLLTALIVPVQLLLMALAMSGFRQAWHVEVEQAPEEPADPPAPPARGGPSPAAA